MALVNWKEREKEQRRNDIINVAEKLFFNQDYDNVSMDEIAREMGLGKGTLYIYFKNKESLFYAVALRGMRILNDMHLKSSKLKGKGIDKFRALTSAYFEFTQDYPEYFILLCYAASNPTTMNDNKYAKEFTELALENIQVTKEILEKGMREGSIRRDLNPTEIAIFLSIIANSIMNMDPVWKITLEATGTDKEQIWEHYLRFITPAIETNHELELSVSLKEDDKP